MSALIRRRRSRAPGTFAADAGNCTHHQRRAEAASTNAM
jgi:hypothetical protein